MSAARALLLALALALPRPGLADMCPAADLIGPGMIDRICWSCLFPLRLGGVTLIGSALATGGRDANGFALSSRPGVPARAATDPVCLCDTGALPIAGVSSGMWMPTTLYEPTLKPGCAPVLGGIDLGVSDPLYLGSSGGTEGDLTQQSFNHMHSYSYPVLHLMELFTRCGHSHADIDLLYLSEIDPSWNDPILALYGTPLSAFGTSRAAVAACPADAVAAALGRPIDSLFWCGGSWSTTLAPIPALPMRRGRCNIPPPPHCGCWR